MKRFGLLLLLSCLVACKSDLERAKEIEAKETKKIEQAQQKVEAEKSEARTEVADALASGDVSETQEEKIEATKEIANAEKKVDDAKINATEEIADANQDAGLTHGTFKRD